MYTYCTYTNYVQMKCIYIFQTFCITYQQGIELSNRWTQLLVVQPCVILKAHFKIQAQTHSQSHGTCTCTCNRLTLSETDAFNWALSTKYTRIHKPPKSLPSSARRRRSVPTKLSSNRRSVPTELFSAGQSVCPTDQSTSRR